MLGLLLTSIAAGDELAEKGRAIFNAHREAVITIEVVINQQVSFSGSASRENESKSELTGTVISPEGLTVASLSEIDPSSIFDIIMAGAQREGMTMTTEVRSAKFLMPDQTEIEAEVILRDKDLDLAYLRPLKKPETPMTYVNFSDADAVEHLDPVISINQLGRVARRAHTVSIERIEAVVERPRTFYIPGNDPTNTGLGSPAFTLDGKPVGVFLLRAISTADTGGLSSLFGGLGDGIISVLLPGADIVDGASQAPPYAE
jgi:S1-C subfamily serine protease